MDACGARHTRSTASPARSKVSRRSARQRPSAAQAAHALPTHHLNRHSAGWQAACNCALYQCDRHFSCNAVFLLCCRLLALCAHLAAGLPYCRADEAHTVVYHVNVLVSRRGEDVRSALKLSLDDRLPDSKSPGQETPQVHTCIMSMVLCMHLFLACRDTFLLCYCSNTRQSL